MDTGETVTLTNHLPYARGSLLMPESGEGLPVKLAAKIKKGEFVEMGELLLEFWSSTKGDDESGKGWKSRKVTNIFIWLQCFCAYVSVRAPQAPYLIPELMAYTATIVCVSQHYAGHAWVCYDAAFH